MLRCCQLLLVLVTLGLVSYFRTFDNKIVYNLKTAGEIWMQFYSSVIFVNENKNENGEKRENNEFVNEN